MQQWLHVMGQILVDNHAHAMSTFQLDHVQYVMEISQRHKSNDAAGVVKDIAGRSSSEKSVAPLITLSYGEMRQSRLVRRHCVNLVSAALLIALSSSWPLGLVINNNERRRKQKCTLQSATDLFSVHHWQGRQTRRKMQKYKLYFKYRNVNSCTWSSRLFPVCCAVVIVVSDGTSTQFVLML